MKTIVVHVEGGETFKFKLSDKRFALWQRLAAAKGQTIDESFVEILRDHMARHPIIAQSPERSVTDPHDDVEAAYLRRVKDPNPLLEDLARQAVDALEARAHDRNFLSVTGVCAEFGVPIAYVLDERERRAREAQ